MNWIDFAKKYNIENPLEFFADLESVSRKADKPILQQTDVSSCADNDKPLTQCMAGRDTECNHPKCPVTDEDAANGRYCTLPLYDWRQ